MLEGTLDQAQVRWIVLRPTPRPKAWTAAYRTEACDAINKLYDITPVVDTLTAATGTLSFQNGDYAAARDDASQIVALGLQAQAIVVGLPVWAPGGMLESDITSAGHDLGAGAATFIDGLDTSNTDTMRTGALQMSIGGPEVTVAQDEYDSLASLYGGSCP